MAAAALAVPERYIKRIESPLGRIELLGDGAALIGLSIERDGKLPGDGLAEATDLLLEAAAAQLGEYFQGRRSEFHLRVALHGTPFQVQVWSLLAAVPFGVTTSYAKLAADLGNPAAARAVGGAVGANPVPIIVPCHRVLGRNGAITGYSAGAGIPTKRWLLGREGVSTGLARAAIAARA